MKIIYSDRHRLHAGDKEMYRGQLVPCFEKPERADFVYDAVKEQQSWADPGAEGISGVGHRARPCAALHSLSGKGLGFVDRAGLYERCLAGGVAGAWLS